MVVVIVIWLPFIVSSAKWILKQSGLTLVSFVRHIDHDQTLQIGSASIQKEDILLISLLKTLFSYQ